MFEVYTYQTHKHAFYFTAPGRFFNIILTVMKTLGTKKSQEIWIPVLKLKIVKDKSIYQWKHRMRNRAFAFIFSSVSILIPKKTLNLKNNCLLLLGGDEDWWGLSNLIF